MFRKEKIVEQYSQMVRTELSKGLGRMVGGVDITRSKAEKEKYVFRVVDLKGLVGFMR